MGRKIYTQCPFFDKLALIIKKFINWSWKLCEFNPQQLALDSTKTEGLENAKGKQAFKKTYNSFRILKRSG